MGQTLSKLEKSKKSDNKKKPDPLSYKVKSRSPSSTKQLLPNITPIQPCSLKVERLDTVRKYLKIEKQLIRFTRAEAKKNASVLSPSEVYKHIANSVRGTPVQIASLNEVLDDSFAIISSTTLPKSMVIISSIVDKNKLKSNIDSSVLINKANQDIVGILEDDEDTKVSAMRVETSPGENFDAIGGLRKQMQEVREAVELPLTRPELFQEVGISPPKGVIFYGPPGTGKTLMAKAIANETSATFLRLVGSELVQKYLGEGPKLVRKLFKTAVEFSPSIVFIDEIDAIGTRRKEARSSGDREIQRTMLELLNQLDGFDDRSEVRVIMATNKIEALDPALIRPGRIDRKIEFSHPDEETKRAIFKIHTGRMALDEDVKLEEFVKSKDDFSGAEIKAICTEAGLQALRERRTKVKMNDFRKAVNVALFKKKGDVDKILYA